MNDLDLNLLRVFATLMELRSVTRTAARLGLTQSAVSHALGRLRRTLDDPLFLRGPGGLQPTTRAEEIAPTVRDGLAQLGSVLVHPLFDPGRASRRFTIAAGAYFCILLVPALIERIRREAPGVSLRIVPVTETLVTQLDEGVVDLVLSSASEVPPRFVAEPLYDETMVWIAAAGSTLATQPFDAERIASHPRVVIAVSRLFDTLRGTATDALHQQFVVNRPLEWAATPLGNEAMTVYDSQTAVAVVARTDLVALVPQRIAMRASEAIIVLNREDDARFSLSMLWHNKQRADVGLAWLRATIRLSVES